MKAKLKSATEITLAREHITAKITEVPLIGGDTVYIADCRITKDGWYHLTDIQLNLGVVRTAKELDLAFRKEFAKYSEGFNVHTFAASQLVEAYKEDPEMNASEYGSILYDYIDDGEVLKQRLTVVSFALNTLTEKESVKKSAA